MAEKFRSYGVARSYFSFIEFTGWCIIVLSAIVSFVILSNSQGYGAQLGIVSAIGFGVVGGFLGLMCIGMAQFWRAGVDSAEYSQQMLSIARDQLTVSRQSLNAQNGQPQSFAELKPEPPISQMNMPSELEEKQTNGSASDNATKASSKIIIKHMGHSIEKDGGKYIVEGRSFKNLEQAEKFVDLNLLPKKLAKKQVKSDV